MEDQSQKERRSFFVVPQKTHWWWGATERRLLRTAWRFWLPGDTRSWKRTHFFIPCEARPAAQSCLCVVTQLSFFLLPAEHRKKGSAFFAPKYGWKELLTVRIVSLLVAARTRWAAAAEFHSSARTLLRCSFLRDSYPSPFASLPWRAAILWLADSCPPAQRVLRIPWPFHWRRCTLQAHTTPDQWEVPREYRHVLYSGFEGPRTFPSTAAGGCGSTWRRCRAAMSCRWFSRSCDFDFVYVCGSLPALVVGDERILWVVSGHFEQWNPVRRKSSTNWRGTADLRTLGALIPTFCEHSWALCLAN